MKIFHSPLWKALGLTVALSLALTLFLYAAAPLAQVPIGQVILFLGVSLLPVAATCLFAGIPVKDRRSLWLCLAVSLPTYLILSVVSLLVYGDRLASSWPGYDLNLAWLLFLLLSLTAWWVSVCAVTLLRHVSMSITGREERRLAEKAARGLRAQAPSVTPGRTRLISTLWGLSWTLGFYVLTGLLLELLSELSIADTILSYVAFPCLWCILAAGYRRLRACHTPALTVTASVTNLAILATVMLFLLPSNVTRHVGYALLYLDSVLTAPFEHPEQLLLIAEFLAVWIILPLCGKGHSKKTPV